MKAKIELEKHVAGIRMMLQSEGQKATTLQTASGSLGWIR
jgi:hypothetical protein